ncbi:F-box protein-like protein [Tanacetum coccineum]|uniref:F-box protein-like protein n=1 Tax=Tanacetum coccineum TaxID=301880 RepID=A0ABQ5BXH8_9ASTR
MEEEYDDVPKELIHLIQSFLPPKDAARTCVLSKSWLHAWSTVNTLRFAKCGHLTLQEQIDYINCIDHTLLRYLNQNLSIDCFHLHLHIHNLSFLPYPLDNWFQALTAFSYSTLKELSLTMCGVKVYTLDRGWLTLPDAIFSFQNLDILSLRADNIHTICQVRVNACPVIKCSFLRVLELIGVCITEEALHNLFSSCSLLEKINLDFGPSVRLKMIKVTNLRCLCELKIVLVKNDLLEMYDLPSLHLFSYCSVTSYAVRMDTLESVRELVLLRLTVDDAFSDMIKTNFPFLETLTLSIEDCMLETINITCVSLKRLTLSVYLDKQLNIQVYASKLLYFSYNAWKMATLLFPSGTPAHIHLILRFLKNDPIDLSFFFKVRKALDLSSNFHIETIDDFVPSNINLDDLRRMVPFPARNVQQLSFGKHWAKKLWKHSPLLDFLFSICYPRYVKAYYRSSNSKNYLYKQMVGIMYKKMCNLKDIEIKNPHDGKWESLRHSWRSYPHDGKWESLAYSWRSFHDEGNNFNSDEFKLNWVS